MMPVIRERYEPGPLCLLYCHKSSKHYGRCSNLALSACLNTAIKSCARLRDDSQTPFSPTMKAASKTFCKRCPWSKTLFDLQRQEQLLEFSSFAYSDQNPTKDDIERELQYFSDNVGRFAPRQRVLLLEHISFVNCRYDNVESRRSVLPACQSMVYSLAQKTALLHCYKATEMVCYPRFSCSSSNA
jgi:hypothetical protein